MEIKPLNIKVTRCVIEGQMCDLIDYEEYVENKDKLDSSTAILENYKGQNLVLFNRGSYPENGNPGLPGIYDAGCIDIVVYPDEENINRYIPEKIIDISNTTPMKEMLERKETMNRLDEPWITSPDNVTTFTIFEEDKPEMVCLKTALNKKGIDIDKYSNRFGQNFPNDKRQLKNNSATLNIIKRFCQHMDMEALITLRDKNPDVPNPMGVEITMSLTDDYSDEEDES